MIVRSIQFGDAEIAAGLHEGSGYDFKFPSLDSPLIESGCVVLDAAGEPIAIAIAKRAPELILAMRKDGHAAVKLQALAILHRQIWKELNVKGYTEANCFLPPELEKNYGRHLQTIFGWIPSWKAYTIRQTEDQKRG